jgi:hypothetical protein
MADNTVLFSICRDDVVGCAEQMGIPKESMTDDVLRQVQKGLEWGLECWSEVVETAINMALKS